MFIVFEGIDGSGKTTLSCLLHKELIKRNISTVWTCEPFLNGIRELLKSGGLDPWGESFLFLADRREHVLKFIKPNLKLGNWVISDRYYLSTLAYQGYGRGLPIEKLKRLNKMVIENIEPDLWVYVDVPVEVALERLKKRSRDHFEEEEFLKRVKEGFEELFKGRLNTIILDGAKSPKENIELLLDALLK